MKKIILLISFILVSGNVFAQDETVIDTRGKEFWFAFPPNYHNNANSDDDRRKFGDSLMIFITAEEDARGTITYYDVFGNEYQQDFVLNNSQEIYNFNLSYYDFEIPGRFTDRFHSINGFPQILNYNETPVKMSFNINLDSDIRVYVNSQATTTSEAMLIYPKKSLGKTYLVMSYLSDPSNGFSRTPSQFLITAIEDNTNITITPTAPTIKNDVAEQNITLDQGESYLVQADVENFGNIDLTGSEIIADKPIAVIGSHQRAKVPQDENLGTSRDILLEQMPPLEVWGSSAFIVPFPEMETSDLISNDYDFFRILAYYDETIVNFNDSFEIVLDKSEFFEGPIDDVYNINSNKPILVAKFKKSSTFSSGGFTSYRQGDPFMMIIPTAELYLNNYTFTSVQAYELEGQQNNTYQKVYTKQYVTIIIEEDYTNTIELDGNPVDQTIFNSIPNSNFVFAHIEDIGDGTHNISAASNFGIYLYGIGRANSYGYVGGMNLNPIDHTPPEFTSSIDCYEVSGDVLELNEIDSKISEIEIQDVVNTTLNTEDWNKYQAQVNYSVELVDKFQDGSCTILATDSIGLENQLDIVIPGFTVGITNIDDNEEFLSVIDSIPTVRTVCYEVVVENYGDFVQNINSVELLINTENVTIEPTEFTLQPGESITIDICFTPQGASDIEEQLYIGNDCIERKVAEFIIKPIEDPQSPGFEFTVDDCFSEFNFSIFDNRIGDFGLENISIVEQENCIINIPQTINPMQSNINIVIEDPYQDAYFIISAIDSSGKETLITETIPGFTIAYGMAGIVNDEYELSRSTIGNLLCESIMLENYGAFKVDINKLHLANNIDFTIPLNQLPISLESGEQTTIDICFNGNLAKNDFYRDTLVFANDCVSLDLPIRAKADSLIRNTSSRCDVELVLASGKIGRNYGISNIYPNPANSEVNITISTEKSRNINIELINISGSTVFSIDKKLPDKGIYDLNIDLSDINSGSYFIKIVSENDIKYKPLLINK